MPLVVNPVWVFRVSLCGAFEPKNQMKGVPCRRQHVAQCFSSKSGCRELVLSVWWAYTLPALLAGSVLGSSNLQAFVFINHTHLLQAIFHVTLVSVFTVLGFGRFLLSSSCIFSSLQFLSIIATTAVMYTVQVCTGFMPCVSLSSD